jgi:hypothetical protein
VNCKECGVGIFEGERFYDSEKGPICEDCMDDMTVSEMLELFGEKFTIAEMV